MRSGHYTIRRPIPHTAHLRYNHRRRLRTLGVKGGMKLILNGIDGLGRHFLSIHHSATLIFNEYLRWRCNVLLKFVSFGEYLTQFYIKLSSNDITLFKVKLKTNSRGICHFSKWYKISIDTFGFEIISPLTICSNTSLGTRNVF